MIFEIKDLFLQVRRMKSMNSNEKFQGLKYLKLTCVYILYLTSEKESTST